MMTCRIEGNNSIYNERERERERGTRTSFNVGDFDDGLL